MLQNLANKPSYAKEPYMARLSPFIEENQTRLAVFLNALCEVDDFHDQIEMQHYIALSKRQLSINISLNEMYQMHALLVQHQSTIVTFF